MRRGEVDRRVRDWVPNWWRGEGGALGGALDRLLWPAELLFRVGVAARNRAYNLGIFGTEAAPIPVVSVGNIGVGGAGKTPFAAWVASRLEAWGARPAVVVSGYGADEVLVHRELNPGIPVIAARRRLEGVTEATRRGRDVAVLDDAFQHRAIARDLDIVLVAADGWRGTRRLLPRGPWREGLDALSRADLVVITRKAASDAQVRAVEGVLTTVIGGDRLVRCSLRPGPAVPLGKGGEGEGPERSRSSSFTGRAVLVVTSLADPAPFVAQIRRAAAEVEHVAFPDHHAFTSGEVADLVRRAGSRPLVMTRKEAVKLRPLLPNDAEALMVGLEVVIESGAAGLDEALRSASKR